MKIIAFAGSNSTHSINRKLVQHALTFFPGYIIELIDINDYEVPIYSFDRQTKYGIPGRIYEFRQKLDESDMIICSLAEHNRSYSAAFKNIFDWASRIDLNVFRNKPMLLMSTSPGDYGGSNVMAAALSFFPHCGANILGTFSLPAFHRNFQEGTGILDEGLNRKFTHEIGAFKERVAHTIQSIIHSKI